MGESGEGHSGGPNGRLERQSLRLRIDPVVERADQIAREVAEKLPTHKGLRLVSKGVADAAREAKLVSQRLQRPLGWHRLPAVFLVVSIAAFGYWIYHHYFYAARLAIAVSARDAVQLKENVQRRVRITTVETEGSRESIEKILSGSVDVAFIQGGVEFPDDLPRIDLEQTELVLLFLRDGVDSPADIRKIMTSSFGQGSHSLAKRFARVWGIDEQVRYVFDWRLFTTNESYEIDDAVDAVFVVKDPMSQSLEGTAKRLEEAGFRLSKPDIGAMSLRLEFLHDAKIRAGYLDPVAKLPAATVDTYAVSTYLVTRKGLSNHQLVAARHLAHQDATFPIAYEPSLAQANEVAQGAEAWLNIAVYIGLAFLGLLGLDIVAYRKRFNELNTLVSLISMHQSSKDVIDSHGHVRVRHIAYLRYCSDLLGLIGVITGYYGQENASLLYNRLLEIIHERCNGLKINIQLKILHATIQLPEDSQDAVESVGEANSELLVPERDALAATADPVSTLSNTDGE